VHFASNQLLEMLKVNQAEAAQMLDGAIRTAPLHKLARTQAILVLEEEFDTKLEELIALNDKITDEVGELLKDE
jgi:TolB-like protein